MVAVEVRRRGTLIPWLIHNDSDPGLLKQPASLALRYGVAALSVGIALAATVLLEPLVKLSPYTLALIAIMFAALFLGLGPGLFATILVGIVIDYLFVKPLYSLRFDWIHVERIGGFIIVAVPLSLLMVARQRAVAELRKAHDELEVRVQERTKELGKTNLDLQSEISERREAEARLAQVARELEERNTELLRLQNEIGRVERLAALGRVAGTIAHELGTPLNSVLGYTQLLSEDKLPESAQRRLKIIRDQVERMIEIIRQYLSRARGSFQSQSPVDINQLIEETLEILKPIFQEHRVRVETALAPGLPQPLGERTSLQRVVINVLDNAIDAMEGGGKVTVRTRSLAPPEHPQGGVDIVIQDSGAGIPPDLLPKIFEMFVTSKAPGVGSGMGLAVCQEIVKGHGGTIGISSEAGRGTTVTVFLPTEHPVGLESSAEAQG